MLSESVLVLNRSWLAIHIADARRAISLVYQGLAKIVNPEDFATYDFDSWRELSKAAEGRRVYTVNFSIKIPEVIVLNFFNGHYYKDVKFSRRSIFERDQNTCQYCGRKFNKTDLTIDHIIPRSRGGKDTWDNLVIACVTCNVHKGQRLPEEAGMPLLRPARKPQWLPHLGVRLSSYPRDSWQRFIDAAYWDVELRE